MMKILITGFEPFGESPINPSQMLVNALSERSLPDITLSSAVLPVDQAKAPEIIQTLIRQCQPEAILAFGQAAGRTKISLERVAINLQDFRIPDNRGITLTDQPISPEGAPAFFATLPLRSLHSTLVNAGIPVEISLSAGTYLCNLVFYTIMHTLASSQLTVPAGFIHLPALPQQVAVMDKPFPSMSFDTMLQAAEIVLTRLAAHTI